MNYPPLEVSAWKDTRDTLHKYCKMVGLIRERLSNPLPRWQHLSLMITERGITSTPIIKNNGRGDQQFEVIIDLLKSQLVIESNFRETKYISLTGQSLSALCDETCSMLQDIGINPPIEKPNFLDGKRGHFNQDNLSKYWKAITKINRVLQRLKSGLGGDTSPVQLWPHHFDLAVNWYAGKTFNANKIDLANEDEEQIGFGFSTGDASIAEPYFYVTVYPPDQFQPNETLPKNFYWNTLGFTGAVLNYKDLIGLNNASDFLYNGFLEIFEIYRHKFKV